MSKRAIHIPNAGTPNFLCILLTFSSTAQKTNKKNNLTYTQTFENESFPIRHWENLHSKPNHPTHVTRFHADDPFFSMWTVNLGFPAALWGWHTTAAGSSPSPPAICRGAREGSVVVQHKTALVWQG